MSPTDAATGEKILIERDAALAAIVHDLGTIAANALTTEQLAGIKGRADVLRLEPGRDQYATPWQAARRQLVVLLDLHTQLPEILYTDRDALPDNGDPDVELTRATLQSIEKDAFVVRDQLLHAHRMLCKERIEDARQAVRDAAEAARRSRTTCEAAAADARQAAVERGDITP